MWNTSTGGWERGWRTVECCSGSCACWGTRGATRSWRSMCGHGGEAASPRRKCALTLRPGNGLEPVRDGDFRGTGSNSPGNGLLLAGAEPLGGRASETEGGANLHFVRCRLASCHPRGDVPWRCRRHPPAGPLPVGNARSAGRSDLSNSHRHQRSGFSTPSSAVQAGPSP